MKTILVCGGREWRGRGCIHIVLMCEPSYRGWSRNEPVRVIHGDARGADRIAGEVARELGYPVKTFPAQWATEGRRAGILRNLRMLDERPDLVLAFGGGRGTNHTVSEAKERGIPVREFGRN